MQKILGVILIGATLILGAICFLQSREVSEQRKQIADLKSAAGSNAAKLESQEVTIKKLQKQQRASLDSETRALIEENSQLNPAAKNPSAESKTAKDPNASSEDSNEESGLGGYYAKMLSDPKMKEAMRQQQKQMIKMMYGSLLKELKLSPEDSDKFTSLLMENQMAGIDKWGELMKAGDKTEISKAMAKQREETESQIKSLLGDERFGQYKDYSESMADRMALDQFKGQTGDNPLREDQTKSLLQIMREERKNSSMPDFSKAENYSLLSSEDSWEKLLEQQGALNQRVRERAATILSPEQLDSLGTFQTNQLEMQKMGMNMAKSMFKGKTNQAQPAP